jgi:hypothetical protein
VSADGSVWADAHTAGMNFALFAAVIPLDGRPRYIHHGWFLISYANLIVIVAMIVVFALAIVVPFPGGKNHE